MNNYCRLPELLGDMVKPASVTDDPKLVRLIESVSRGFDGARVLNRQVFAEYGTRYVDGDGSRELLLDFDLLAVTGLTVDTDGDGTYETTLTEGTHYRLTPRNRPNKRAIELLSAATISAWPEYPDAVRIVGQFGYRAMWESTGQTVQNVTEISAGGTSLQLTASAALAVGDLLVIESEEVYVTAIPDGTHATIERAQNGTTAAAHANGTAINRRRYPADIELACRLQVARVFGEMRTGQSAANAELATGGFTWASLYPHVRDLLQNHRHLVVH